MNRTAPSAGELTLAGVMTAVLCITGPLAVPLPGLVPVSLATLVLFLLTYLLGRRRAAACCALYLAIGAVGVPVFSGFSGGFAAFAGPTGGYLLGYLPLVWAFGSVLRRRPDGLWSHLCGMALGTALCYLPGTLWLARTADLSVGGALLAGVVPFLPGDAAKLLLAGWLGPLLRRRLGALAG